MALDKRHGLQQAKARIATEQKARIATEQKARIAVTDFLPSLIVFTPFQFPPRGKG